ncbi:hypothetical protein P5G50_13615 [Leifsonia sp. F6_8S_P_1B]|uniref:Transcriptional regulator, AbiEi antitoxin, Type IV TA system n=1 Tax=Leifsonia williamsii TaxID=3035919 RepID=A0ABT8KEQ2_9MICO|nr:hypothetical protein [Leifsonia williamsii]MDN4615487.1 hypothetical protein [Leifsonia williamsii]
MTTLCPPLLDGSVMPLAELLALCLDGQLFRVGDAFACPDTPDTPELRARSLDGQLPADAILERGTAAWVHGTRSSPPGVPQVCRRPGAVGGKPPAPVDLRRRMLAPDEVTAVGSVAATTPLRTAADLLLQEPFGGQEALEVRHLLRLAGAPPGALLPLVPCGRRVMRQRVEERVTAVRRARLPRE